MNKKFSTLVASVLLAGGMITPSLAENLEQVAVDANKNQYYYVFVNGTANTVPSIGTGEPVSGTTSGVLDEDAKDGYSYEKNESTWWLVEKVTEKVNGVDKVLGYKLINAATNKPLSVTVKEGGKDVTYDVFTNNTGGLQFVTADGSKKYYNGKSDELGTNTEGSFWRYNLQAVKPQKQTVTQLNDWSGDSFDLDICYQPLKSNGAIDDKDPVSYDAKGNVFAEALFAEDKDGDGNVELYQLNSKKRIVLLKDKWGNITNSLEEAGYKFAVLNEKEYDAAENILADEFTITKPATLKGEPLEVVAIDATNKKYELVVSGVDGVYYVTTSADTNVGIADYTADGSTNANNTYVKFGKGNSVDNDIFIGQLWEIYKNDKIASPDCDVEFVAPSQVATGYPEGQWLWNDEAEVFVNRESGKTLAYPGLRLTDKDGVYTSGDDTWTITAVGTPGESEEGYLHGYTNDQLKQKAFFIGAPVDATKDTIYLSKNAAGVLKFTADESEAVEFRLTPKVLDNKHQTVQIRNTYTAWKDKADKVKESKVDAVSFTQYVITEAVSGKTLYYDAKEERYVLATAKEAAENKNLTEAPEFLIKNKKADTYNIVFFGDEAFGKEKDDKYHYVNAEAFCNKAEKLLSAFNVSELVKTKDVYALVQNDLFIVKDADALQYRSDFSDNGALDTIKIFRNDDNSYVLYEQGKLLETKDEVLEGFLGMENVYDPKFADMQPALLADTAFHANTYRPQYMLAVDAKIVPAGKYCSICGEEDCAHAEATRGFIDGRYLVNLVDSAKACDDAIKNKFTHELYQDDEPYYRLGFVQARHIGDTLVIASTNDTIDLAANRPDYDKVSTFAFRYVDADRDAFTIETVYDYELDSDGDFSTADKDDEDWKNGDGYYKRGYIKYHNGIPVVTPKASEAWVFDLEELTGEENAPTANDEIAVSEVSVVAGNGTVTVKGAAGKQVVITNVLGQTIANTVLSSDNATINVPAGIIIVAVEGEAAVKAIVK